MIFRQKILLSDIFKVIMLFLCQSDITIVICFHLSKYVVYDSIEVSIFLFWSIWPRRFNYTCTPFTIPTFVFTKLDSSKFQLIFKKFFFIAACTVEPTMITYWKSQVTPSPLKDNQYMFSHISPSPFLPSIDKCW